MTTFQQIVLKCPYCHQPMSDYEMTSFIVRSSTVYSDGKSVTEPFPQNDKTIRVCPACNRPFWSEDAIIDREPDYSKIDSFENALNIYDLLVTTGEDQPEGKINYYKKLLKESFANNNKRKFYLRIRLWWAINDLVRYPFSLKKKGQTKAKFHVFRKYIKNKREQHALFKSFKDLFTDNISQLILLSDTENEEGLIMLAEMFRETGKFREAKHTIDKLRQTNISIKRKIKKAILFRKRRVFKIRKALLYSS